MTDISQKQGGWTPGPWKACGTIYKHMNAEIRSGRKGEGQGIAQVWDGPNAFRDAMLMAAAPDLYEALQAARDALHQHYIDWDGEPEDAVPLQLARAKCEAALSRANPSTDQGEG